MSSILVTGGAGYIGSHFVLHALEKKNEVVILDDLSTGKRNSILGGVFYKGDISDHCLVKKIFAKHNIEAVFHFAASIQIKESIDNPFKYYQNNVSNTLVLLDEMQKASIRYIVFSSTAATYGEPQYTPIDTFHPQNPTNPYGSSKLMVEQMLRYFDNAYNIKYSILRYFNAAGADPEGRIGFHESITNLIPNALKVATGRSPCLKIFGINFDTPDGTCIRDYIHVMDLASAHLLALQKLRRDNVSHIYNLGNGNGFSVKEVIEKTKCITGKNFSVTEADRRPGDCSKVIAKSSLAQKELFWNPQYTDLVKIITDAYQWELRFSHNNI